MIKILAIGDLHGRKPIIKTKDFDAIVFVGDVNSDKEMAPLTKKWFEALRKDKDTTPAVDEFIISLVGKREFNNMEKRSLEQGRKIMKYLNSFGKPIFMVGGNWDQSYGKSRIKEHDKNDYNYMKAFLDWWLGDKLNPKLTGGFKNVKNCMYHLYKFSGLNILGYGLSSGPERIGGKRKIKNVKGKKLRILQKYYRKIIEKLNKVYEKRNKKLPTIFISHNIPYKTKLDIIRNKKNYAHKKHLGSTIARQFCSRHQPLLCIGGHIHDYRGKDKIRKTLVINPGFGSKAQVLIEIDEKRGKVKNIRFIH